jgi:nitrate reductase assembly molybdenum cofactor insertion protein NarJ
MTGRDDLQSVASTLERPSPGYMKRLDRARAVTAGRPIEVARHLGLFADRIGDLTIDELRELHDETFGNGPMARIEPLVHQLACRHCDEVDARVAVNVLAPLLDRLESDRNPFAHAVRALCCLLLSRTAFSEKERSIR